MKIKILIFLIIGFFLHNFIKTNNIFHFFPTTDIYQLSTTLNYVNENNPIIENNSYETENPSDILNKDDIIPNQNLNKEILEFPSQNIFKNTVSDGKTFVRGNCTWFAAKYRTVTWRGHAKYWYDNAKRQGYLVGKIPVPGALVIFDWKGAKYGHVAIVKGIYKDYIWIREMNVLGLNKVSERLIKKDNYKIKGYIYSDMDAMDLLSKKIQKNNF